MFIEDESRLALNLDDSLAGDAKLSHKYDAPGSRDLV